MNAVQLLDKGKSIIDQRGTEYETTQDRLHEDSVIDGINYAALKGEELYKQYSREAES